MIANQKALGACVAALVKHPQYPSLKAAEVGCWVQWSSQMIKGNEDAIQLKQSLHFSGLNQDDFGRMVSGMEALGLITLGTDACVSLPIVLKIMAERANEVERRKQGWNKRRSTADDFELTEPTRPSPVSKKPTRARPGVALTATITRLERDSSDDSAVMARVPTKEGFLIEVTSDFIEQLAHTYKGVDVHQEILKACEWCRSRPASRKTARGVRKFLTGWLARAHERNAISFAIAAASNNHRGFGQGGKYSSSIQTKPETLFDDDDQFSDIFSVRSDDAIQTKTR